MHHNLLLLSGSGTRWAQLLVALSLLILLHEFGHFFFARLFKTRVEKFYLFFDFLFPFGGLFNFSLFKKKVGDTEYGIGWFPLGGYVKIAGMVDESMDKEQLAKPPEPWEYRSKPAWQRLFIMLGGIIMNILVAMILFTVVFGVYGEKHLPLKNITTGLAVDSIGQNIGLKDGDEIVALNGKPATQYEEFTKWVYDDPKSITVRRDGQILQPIAVPDGTVGDLINNGMTLFQPRIAPVIETVESKSVAAGLGLKSNDSIESINGIDLKYYDELRPRLQELKNTPITIFVSRDHHLHNRFEGKLNADGILGVKPNVKYERYFHFDTVHYNPIQAVGKGTAYALQRFAAYGKSLKMLGKKNVKVSKSVGGFATFAKVFDEEFSMEAFLKMMALISVILAFMNLLPVPGLDGGYVVFTLWEMITGKKVNDKVMEVATTIGLVLLLALMLYANGLDIFKYFKK